MLVVVASVDLLYQQFERDLGLKLLILFSKWIEAMYQDKEEEQANSTLVKLHNFCMKYLSTSQSIREHKLLKTA